MSDQEFQSLNSMVFTSAKDTELVMEDQRFFASKKPREALQETSMFTTLVLDSETKIDMYVKVKQFHTKTDGAFHLVTLAEVDVMSKVVTGRYIVLKLSEQKDLELEQSIIKEQELKYKQDVIQKFEDLNLAKRSSSSRVIPNGVIRNQLNNQLEVIEERNSEGTPNFTQHNHFFNDNLCKSELQQDEFYHMRSLHDSILLPQGGAQSAFKSQIGEELNQFEVLSKTKVSVVVDFISSHINQMKQKKQGMSASLTDKNKQVQQKLVTNFCLNVSKLM